MHYKTIQKKATSRLFQEIREETLKVRPLYGKKKTNLLNSRVRYHAIAMAGDGEGFYGYAEAIKKSDRAAEATARSRSTLNWIQLRLGCAPLRNPHTVRREARGRNGSVVVVLRPAPRGVGVNGPPMIRKMLPVIGIRDCLVRVKGGTRRGVNLARAVNSAIRQLL